VLYLIHLLVIARGIKPNVRLYQPGHSYVFANTMYRLQPFRICILISVVGKSISTSR